MSENKNNTIRKIQENGEGKLPALYTLRRRLVNHAEEKGEETFKESDSKERHINNSNPFDIKSKFKTFYLSKTSVNGRNDPVTENKISRRNTNDDEERLHNSGKLHDIVHGYSDQLKYIRKSPLTRHQHSRQFQTPSRRVAEGMPEVHFIGEIRKGLSFALRFSSPFAFSSSSAISCKWKLEWGQSFSHLAGVASGQTQYAMIDEDDKECIWNHPIDIHFAAASLKGWPRIILQLWELDKYGRSSLVGFGFAHFPCSKGQLIKITLSLVYVKWHLS